MTCKKFSNSTKEIEQHKKEKLYYTCRKSRHLAQDYQWKLMEQGSQKKTQGQARKTTKKVNTLEATKGRGAYNSLKELNVIDKLDTLEELIELAIRINRRLYKRQLERKGFRG